MTRIALLLATLLAAPALANDPPAAPEPAPAAAQPAPAAAQPSPENIVVETIQMAMAGKHDEWMDKHCSPQKCKDKEAREHFKRYQLASAGKFGGQCLVDGKVDVARWQGDPAKDERFKAYIRCGERPPVPIGFHRVGGKVYIEQLSI